MDGVFRGETNLFVRNGCALTDKGEILTEGELTTEHVFPKP